MNRKCVQGVEMGKTLSCELPVLEKNEATSLTISGGEIGFTYRYRLGWGLWKRQGIGMRRDAASVGNQKNFRL